MKHSRKSDLGYFEINHRMSPGTIEVPEGSHFETDIMRCGHCHRLVGKNPIRNLDAHPRYTCFKCYEYVCDFCGDPLLTGCLNLDQILAGLQEQAFRNLNIKEI